MDSSKYHITSTDIFHIFLIFGVLFVLIALTGQNPFEVFAGLFLFTVILIGAPLLGFYICRYSYRSFNKFCNSINKRKKLKTDKKVALKTERDRIINKINSFVQPEEQIEENNPKKEYINQPIWEEHPREYEDLDPENYHMLRESHKDKASKNTSSNSFLDTGIREQGAYAGMCPVCGSQLFWRRAKKTGELYRGCTNYNGGCHYNERSY